MQHRNHVTGVVPRSQVVNGLAQDDDEPEEIVVASAVLINAEAEEIGEVELIDFGEEGFLGLYVYVDEGGLEPGFHAFHVHSVGVCEHAEGFTTSAGHFNPEGTTHGTHARDLPSLYAMKNGAAEMYLTTDAFTVADLLDEDGSAFIVNAGRDNYANIPKRYGVADDVTLGTGDAGARVACGIVVEGDREYEEE